MTKKEQIDTYDVDDDNEVRLPGQSEFHGQSEEDEHILKEISDNLKKSRGRRMPWRLQAKEDYDFYAGNQWSEEDAAYLAEQERPVVVFNRTLRTINAISGVEIQNRQEAKFYPRQVNINQDPNQPSDAAFSEELTAAVQWAKDETNAEDEESEAFQDMLICGEGWTDTVMDYDQNPEGMIKEERLDPILVDVDVESSKRNYEDAKWVSYTRDLTRKEIKGMFPDLDLSLLTAGPNDTGQTDVLVHDADRDEFYQNDYSFYNPEPYTIPVIKYQCVKKEKVTMALSQDGNMVDLSDPRYAKVKSQIKQMAVKLVSFEKNVYYQYIVVGNILAEKFKMGTDRFTLRAMTGLRDRNNRMWFGMVKVMKDPQRWANKWLSQIQHIVNSNNKGGAYVETDAPQNIREFEEDFAKANAVLKVNPGKLEGIRERQPLQYPGGTDKLLQMAIDAIADTSGVSLEMLGMANRDQPIGLESSRKESAIAVLACFFDALRRYRKMQARVMADFVREYISDGRLIRLLGKTGYRYIPLIRDRVAFEYDVLIDDAPSSPRVKDKTFMVCLKLIEYAIQMQVPVPPDIFDYAPIPFDLAQKWKEMIVQQSEPTTEQQQQQQFQQMYQQMKAVLDIAKDKSIVEKTDSEIQKNQSSAMKDVSVAQEQSALAAEKFGLSGFEQFIRQQEFEAEQQRKNLDVGLSHQRAMVDQELEHIREMMKINNQQQLQQLQSPQGLPQ